MKEKMDRYLIYFIYVFEFVYTISSMYFNNYTSTYTISINTVIPDGIFHRYWRISPIPVTPPLNNPALDKNKFTPREEIKQPIIITTIST